MYLVNKRIIELFFLILIFSCETEVGFDDNSVISNENNNTISNNLFYKQENKYIESSISKIDSYINVEDFKSAEIEFYELKSIIEGACSKKAKANDVCLRLLIQESKIEFNNGHFSKTKLLIDLALKNGLNVSLDPSVLYYRGYCLYVSGELEKSLLDFKQYLNLTDGASKLDVKHKVISLIGLIYSELGEIYLANKYFRTLFDEFKVIDSRFFVEKSSIVSRYIRFLRTFDLEKSIDVSLKAINLINAMSELGIEDKSSLSKYHFDLGNTYFVSNNYRLALKNYINDAIILTETGYGKSNYIANTYKSLGLTYQNLGDFKQAIEYEQKALEIFVNEADNYRIPGCYHNMAWIYDENGYYRKAMKYHQEALKLAIPQFSPESLFDVPALERIKGRQEAIMMYVAYKGKTLWNLYERTSDVSYLHAALAHYQLVSELTDQIRASFEADESKMNLGKTTTEYFEQAVKVCKELFDLTCDLKHASKALQFAEKSKSLTLYEAVRANQIKRFSDFPAKVLEKEQSFRQRIIELEEELYKNSIESSDSIKNGRYLNSELIKVYQAYSDYQDSIKLKYPQYYNLKLNSDSMDIKSIQSTIDNESTVLSYFMGKNQIYGFLINAESFELVEIPLDFPLSQWVDDFQVNMKEYKDRKEAFKKVYIDLGYKLYDRLLKPFKGQMKHKLTIVPHDILSLVSFDALLTDNDSSLVKTPYFYYPFVLYHHNIDYTFSLSLRQLLLNQKNASAKKKKVLAMAPTFYVKDPSRWKADPLAKRGYLDKLSPLIFNGDEVREIKRIWPSKAFIGKNANKHNFFNNASDYQIIHLATHGVVNNEAPSYSFVAFSQLKDSMDYDEVLFVNDLYNIQLNADLVVLSACETGIGPLESGEGMISIGRAFMYAGAKNIVMTLWNIDDNRAHRLMRHFYRALRVEENVKDALYQAKLSFLRYADVNSHPGFWAPFISIGDRSKIEYEAASWW